MIYLNIHDAANEGWINIKYSIIDWKAVKPLLVTSFWFTWWWSEELNSQDQTVCPKVYRGKGVVKLPGRGCGD